MFPPHDAPLTAHQRLLLLICTLMFPPLLLMHAALAVWFQDSFPQRARSFAWVGLTFLQGLAVIVVLTGAMAFIFQALRGF
ncbi:hypothetical protein DEDE109153_03570 [Deinococcus deserti]|uniref:Uncharacterized protein n=1 Tax=Deinococcus deserti (strain DSM 17065 / CIP 109153 / LMG 22923 / VCD115) TaxID=546414 RepID=C1D1P7_DEIDV|nr:hypothetical protein [Deinococcus deserti]ACO45771.1 hypothetical protein; putative membrane protein [Deinococcus deserti VCD115]